MFVDKHNNAVSHYRWRDKSSKWFPLFVGATRHQSHLDWPLSAWTANFFLWREISLKTETDQKKQKKNQMWNLTKGKNRSHTKMHTHTKKTSAASSTFAGHLCSGECEEKCKQIKKNQKKIQCFFASHLFLVLSLFSSLSNPTPHHHHVREVNASTVRLESRLFDLDSKPAFLNKYSVAREWWCVPLLPQITGYVWGKCLRFEPSHHRHSLWRTAYRKYWCCITLFWPPQHWFE